MNARNLLLATALMSLTAAPSLAAAPVSDGVGDLSRVIEFNYGAPSAVYAPLYVAQDLGLFEKHGLKPNFFSFQSGAPLLAGLKSESLDVVTTGLASVFAIGQGISLKFLFWQGDAALAEGLVARSGVEMESYRDLARAGKIAAPTGTCAQISLYHAARAAGLDYASLDIVNIAPPLYGSAFRSDSVDAALAWSPYLLDLTMQGHRLLGFDPEWVPGGGACPEMTIIREAVLEQSPELAHRLVRVHAEAVEAILVDPAIAVNAVSRRLSVSPQVAARVMDRYLANFPTLEQHVDPSSRFSMVGDEGLIAQLDLAARTFVELGVLQEPIPIEKLREATDVRFVEAYLNGGH